MGLGPTAQVQDLIFYTESILQQTAAFFGAGLPTGGGEIGVNQVPYAIQSDTQQMANLTEIQNRLCRLCLPIQDTAQVQVTTPGSTVLAPYQQCVSSLGRVLCNPTQVSIGNTPLNPGNQGYLATTKWFPPNPSTGDPTGWAATNTTISLSTNSTASLYTVGGFFLPAPLTSVTQYIDSHIDDFSQRTMCFYNAWWIALKNVDNTVLAERIAPCANEWTSCVKEIYTRLLLNDPTMAAIFSPSPIDSMIQFVKQSLPRT